jgi:hypothetical protein
MKSIAIVFALAACLLLPQASKAQMTFPHGKSVDLVTDNGFLYMETRLVFNIGKRKAEQYRWEKISDSSDSRWIISSCFNGDCRNGLPDSGEFVSTYGIADSLCFIAFHVDCMDIDGKAIIKYRVTNLYDSSETADLTIAVTYTNTTGLKATVQDDLSEIAIYPNPTKDFITINIPTTTIYLVTRRIEIFSSTGRRVLCKEVEGRRRQYRFNLSSLPAGVYTVKIPTTSGHVIRRIVITR